MFGRKQKEIERLQARVAELEAELKGIQDEYCPPGSFEHFFKEPPRKYPKSERELSSEEYKKQVLEPMGYTFFTLYTAGE